MRKRIGCMFPRWQPRLSKIEVVMQFLYGLDQLEVPRAEAEGAPDVTTVDELPVDEDTDCLICMVREQSRGATDTDNTAAGTAGARQRTRAARATTSPAETAAGPAGRAGAAI